MLYVTLAVVVAALAAAWVYLVKFNRSLQARFWGQFGLVALLLVITVAVLNLSFERLRLVRVDLTKNKVYTISPHTAKILAGLVAPVQVTYYVSPSEKMPTQMKTLERDVRDKLEELKIVSAGKFRYKVVPVDAQSKLAERLAQKNITPKRIQSIDSDEWSLRTAYSALEIAYLQQDPEVVEFIAPDSLNNLEYELASRIYKLTFHADTTDYADDGIFTLEAARTNLYPRIPGKVLLYYVDTIEQNAAKLPANLVGVRERILNKLKAVADASGGKVEFKAPDPQNTQQLLMALVPRGLIEGAALKSDAPTVGATNDAASSPDGTKEKKVYSGVYLNLFQQHDETVPLVTADNVDRLEIEIHKKIAKKLNRARPKVAVYSPRQAMDPRQMQMMMMMGQPPRQEDRFKALQEILRNENYDVVKCDITPGSPIPADAQTLVVVSPAELTDRQVYEIEKFLHQGRNLIVAAQRNTFDFRPSGSGTAMEVFATPQANKLDETLKNFGVEISPSILMDRNQEIINVSVSRPVDLGGFRAMAQTVELVKSPVQIRLTDANFPGDLSFGNRVARLLYFGGSMLKLDDAKLKSNGIDAKVVARASREAWTGESPGGGPLQAAEPSDPTKFLDRPPLAVLLTGRFPSTWRGKEVPLHTKESSDGKPAEPDPASKEENQIVGDPKESRVLVVGCSELFKDDFMSDTNHQLFFLNAVDALTLGEDLIHVRAKLAPEGSLKPTSEAEKTFWKFFVIGLVPLVLAVVGTVVVAASSIRNEA